MDSRFLFDFHFAVWLLSPNRLGQLVVRLLLERDVACIICACPGKFRVIHIINVVFSLVDIFW